MVGKSSPQEIATLAITSEISDSRVADPDLETRGGGRLGDMIRNLESPGLSGRVDSTELTQSPKA